MSADNFVVIRKFPEGWKWAMGFASFDYRDGMPDNLFQSKAFEDAEQAYKDAEKECDYLEYGIDIEWPDTPPRNLNRAGICTNGEVLWLNAWLLIALGQCLICQALAAMKSRHT